LDLRGLDKQQHGLLIRSARPGGILINDDFAFSRTLLSES
jgi:hypothetical protein